MPGWVIYDTESRRPYIRRLLKTRNEAEHMLVDLLRPYEPWSEWRKRIIVCEWKSARLPYGPRSRTHLTKCHEHPRRHAIVCDVLSRAGYCKKCWAAEIAEAAE